MHFDCLLSIIRRKGFMKLDTIKIILKRERKLVEKPLSQSF